MDNIKKTELNHLQADLADEMSHYAQFKALLVLAFIVTLISYLLFSGHLKLGNPLYWGEYFNKGAVTIAAFVFMLVSVILLGVFLAWVKHFAYNHFTTYRAIAGVMITLVGFALLAEMFAALEDQKAKADIQLEGNSAYQATIAPTGSSISASPTLAADIAAASQKLARCKANLGKPGYKHCDGDKAKLDALENQQTAALNAQVAASSETQKLRYERQDQMKADAHNDFIVGLAQFYAALFGDGTEKAYVAFISWGNITLMLIIAIAFERLHAFLIEAGRNIKGNIRGLEQSIAQMQESTSPLAHNKHLPPVGIPLFKHQQAGNHSPTPFNPATAMAKRDPLAWEENPRAFPGFKDTNNMPKAKAEPDDRPFYGFDDPKKQAALDALNLATGSEDRKTLGKRTTNLTGKPDKPDQPLHERVDIHARVGKHESSDKLSTYQQAEQAKVGTMIDCPQCGTTFQKANKWHTFCCSHCKDTWHNERDPARVEALRAKRRKQARG
ncbi:hypothetical protein [uncultured Thiothrix sp.]|jgi:hypothetical protein|uniref:hypothetical protein n=1 Tax=uncultured Thiothrix sp. TaxID=223185 RepID=UPI00261F0D01|nr:hypothetical protein [uncultured Thiothrix sp.]HRJ95005.1 hypothetical protein [Candidatus Thiothrix moscowensis]